MKTGKRIPKQGQYRIWLVWAIGIYVNGQPLVDLRAVCTRESQAKEKSRMILEWAKTNNEGLQVRRVEIEERITDHCYGLEMQLVQKAFK